MDISGKVQIITGGASGLGELRGSVHCASVATGERVVRREDASRLKKFSQTVLVTAGFALFTLPTWAAFPLVDLSQFYLVYQDPRVQDCGPTPLDATGQAELAIIGGGAEPPAVIGHCTKKRYRTVRGWVGIDGINPSNNDSGWISFYSGAWYERCGGGFSVFRKTGAVSWSGTNWYPPRGPSELVGSTINDPCVSYGANLSPPGIVVESEYITQPLIRRRAVDGGEYDASPLVVKRNGAP